MATEKANNKKANESANNAAANGLKAKTLRELQKESTNFLGGLKAACLALLNRANESTNDEAKSCAKKVCAYLGISETALRGKAFQELRENILARLPLYYTVNGGTTRYPAKLRPVNADMQTAGISKGQIAVRDTYLHALLALAKTISEYDNFTQREVSITETGAITTKEMNIDNTACTVYNKDFTESIDCTEQYIAYRQAKADANAAGRAHGKTVFDNAFEK